MSLLLRHPVERQRAVRPSAGELFGPAPPGAWQGPVIREILSGCVSASSVTLNTAAGTQSGDLLVCFQGNNAGLASDLTTPTGTAGTWTLQATGDGGSGGPHMKVWTRYVTVGGAQTVTVTANVGEEIWEHLFVIYNTDPSDPDGGAAAGSNGTSSTAQVAPSVTSVRNWSLLLCGVQHGGGTLSTYTPPPDMAEASDLNSPANFDGGASATQPWFYIGATGTRTFTASNAGTWATASIAIQPGSAGSATATPTTIAALGAIPAPTVQTGSIVTAATVAATSSVPTPTVQAGSTVTAATVAAVSTIPASTPTVSVAITPTTVAATSAIPAPTVTAGGNATATPTTVATTAAIPAPTLAAGSVVTATTVAASAAILAPTVTVRATVTPTTVAAGSSIPTPTVSTGSTITATTVAATASIPSSTRTVSVAITPTTITVVSTIPGPGLRTSSTLAVLSIDAAVAIPNPTVSAITVVVVGQGSSVVSRTPTAVTQSTAGSHVYTSQSGGER